MALSADDASEEAVHFGSAFSEGEKDLPGEDRARTEESGGNDQIRTIFPDDHINETHRHSGQH